MAKYFGYGYIFVGDRRFAVGREEFDVVEFADFVFNRVTRFGVNHHSLRRGEQYGDNGEGESYKTFHNMMKL